MRDALADAIGRDVATIAATASRGGRPSLEVLLGFAPSALALVVFGVILLGRPMTPTLGAPAAS
jgi:hypothetical protein